MLWTAPRSRERADTQPSPHQGGVALQEDWRPKSLPAAARKPELESTVRYLGIEVDDALSISDQVDL